MIGNRATLPFVTRAWLRPGPGVLNQKERGRDGFSNPLWAPTSPPDHSAGLPKREPTLNSRVGLYAAGKSREEGGLRENPLINEGARGIPSSLPPTRVGRLGPARPSLKR